MNKVHLLGANRSYDRDVQTVSVNQGKDKNTKGR